MSRAEERMTVSVLGDTPELRIYADLMSKAGAAVRRVRPDEKPAPAGVLAYSSDALPQDMVAWIDAQRSAVLCDIAGGRDLLGPSQQPLTEYQMQAAAALTETTGFPGAAPTRSKVPFIAVSTALYAASATLSAMIAARPGDGRRKIVTSRFLSALNALTTYLPSALQGATPTRIGNRHPSSAPWNSYPTSDGWILICTSKDDQWQRLRDLSGQPELNDPRFAVQTNRIALRETIDAHLARWTRTLTTGECAKLMEGASIPAGPILGLDELFEDANFRHRQRPFVEAHRRQSDATQSISLFRITEGYRTPSSFRPLRLNPEKPLAGLRVIELGQFTTAPLACRHLAALGAEVLKIEPPSGDAGRTWEPVVDGVSHYFTISNTGKRFERRDLRDPADMAWLKGEIRNSHVLIENMRPGVLAKLGLSAAELRDVNPRLLTCSVSGFGADSAYPGRGAYDTVIQGMSGLMAQTKSGVRPVKLGISASDILGAQVSLFAIVSVLSALETAGGKAIDISMQDISAYAALRGTNPEFEVAYEAAERWPSRTVRSITEHASFSESLSMFVPDDKGNMRHAIRLPYSISLI
tara:strand:+ start:10326 stop:12074 length:1749 start_codon:yes stop_codon:yes gene_type:complete